MNLLHRVIEICAVGEIRVIITRYKVLAGFGQIDKKQINYSFLNLNVQIKISLTFQRTMETEE